MPADDGIPETAATVLVVDDEEEVRAVAVAALSERFRVLEAGNGREALELLGRERIDVVVTDVAMPGLSGLHVLHGARRRRPALKVLLMSGFAPELSGMSLPGSDFLPKPFRIAELERAVNRLIGA
jgi:two-component system cell cycle sensor histidine kinase/response regulator CckA